MAEERLFDRLVQSAIGDAKIPVHAYGPMMNLRNMGLVTDQQMKNLFELTDHDMGPDGDYTWLKSRTAEVTEKTDRRLFVGDMYGLFLVAETDGLEKTKLRDRAEFDLVLVDLIAIYNGP